MKDRSFLDFILLYFKGLAMGTANKVPGVSGGMIAMVGGFYEELIYSFQKLNLKAIKLLFNKRYSSFFRYINAKFLLIVNLGSISAYFTISLLLDWLLKNYQVWVWSFFFGLIIGSAYYIYSKIDVWKKNYTFLVLIGGIIGLAISFISPQSPNENLFFIFFCGMVGVTGMTLPGFSGSFLLILLGNYVLLMVDSVNNLLFVLSDVFSNDFSFLQNPRQVKLLWVVVVFAIGSLAGMIAFSNALNYLLKNYHNSVVSVLIGFIIGSLGVAWPFKSPVYKTDSTGELILDSLNNPILLTYKRFLPDLSWALLGAILFLILGLGMILVLLFFEKKNNFKR